MIWIDANEVYQYGTVHWIGVLDDATAEYTVGVEFVRYKNKTSPVNASSLAGVH